MPHNLCEFIILNKINFNNNNNNNSNSNSNSNNNNNNNNNNTIPFINLFDRCFTILCCHDLPS